MGARVAEVYDTVKKAWAEVRRNHILDWSAALTYYGMLSLFPALIVLVTLVGLVGDSATDTLLDQMQGFAPGPAREIVEDAVRGIQDAGAATGVFFVVGLVAAIWSASSYVGAFGRASGTIRRQNDRRPGWQTLAARLLTTIMLLALLALVAWMLVFSGPLASQLSQLFGVGDDILEVWNWIRWPLLLVSFALLLALLNDAASGARIRRWRLVSYGSAIAIAIWVVATIGFNLYVAEFARYGKIYGSLAGVVVFLVWIWITNVAMLLGVHIDSMRARTAGTASATSRPPVAD